MSTDRGTHCDCCGNPFEEPHHLYVVLDHDHANGSYRGYVCQSCNVIVGMIERKRYTSLPKVETCIDYIEKWKKIHALDGDHDSRKKRWRNERAMNHAAEFAARGKTS